MKTILLIFVICLSFNTVSLGQCVIYTDDETGAFGAGFNNDGSPTSMQECEDMAIKLCKEKGGTNCTFLYKSDAAGWWAFINGSDKTGQPFFQGVYGMASKSEAESAVREKYRNEGGVDADNIQVYSWYVYSNLK